MTKFTDVKRIAELVKRRPELLVPNMILPDIVKLDFKKMKEMGIEKVMYTEENVIKEPTQFC